MASTWRTTYTVQGAGHFPLDMLRYDESFPQNSEDVGKIDDRIVQRSVNLVHKGAEKDWWPTVERWESFGWRILQGTTSRSQVA